MRHIQLSAFENRFMKFLIKFYAASVVLRRISKALDDIFGIAPPFPLALVCTSIWHTKHAKMGKILF